MYDANKRELESLKFWEKDKTFERSVSSRPESEPYVFYDGPPFATGLPHYGHIVASVMKDVVPRYFTMQGKRVERVWGWDCHGLPIENIVEKEMGTKTKKDIEQMGVDVFNEKCRSKVLSYVSDWQKTIHRLGRWVDMEHAYRTMDNDYMESVWWVFKQLWDKDLVYQDYRSMHICPRCETTLSQQEVSEGYKDVKDISVYVKFELVDEPGTFVLAWTTTPWTLPGNVALAVGADVVYAKVFHEGNNYIVAKERLHEVLKQGFGEGYTHDGADVAFMSGSELVGKSYKPLFPYYKDTPNAFRVVAGDFVTTTDGTGVVHIAPAFGDDDFKVGKRENIPLVHHVGMDGRFNPEVTDFAGQEVKPRSDDDKVRLSSDIAVLKYLQENNLFFAKQNLVHSYPHCWRCDTPLLNYATSSWFVNVTKIKDQALEEAKKINWSPEHIKEGRFGKWLEGARDWSISRQRFWATTMPVWQSEDGDFVCVGSLKELEELSGQKVDDLHKHVLDKVTFEKDGKTYTRVPDVLDTWFDSGSMPYAQVHYPFENKEKFEAGFPAEFIAEGQDQTRAWFYYLHVLGTALKGSPAFNNVIVNGIVLAEDGKKMSKKLKNYPDPMGVIEKYGADAVRYYLVSSPVMHAENLNFAEDGVREVYSKLINTLWNCFEFYKMFAGDATPLQLSPDRGESTRHVLDSWILSKLQFLVKEVTENMEAYKLSEASRPIMEFVTELSQWYVRRSRDRFKGDDPEDKKNALSTLQEVFLTLSKLMAPFTPFIAEELSSELKGMNNEVIESVHLEKWPTVQTEFMNERVLQEMEIVRKLVEMGLSLRSEAKVKVRQPLAQFALFQTALSPELQNILADELNVKEIVEATPDKGEWLEKTEGELHVALNVEVTEELKKEGYVRELVRAINQIRKEMGLTVNDNVVIVYQTEDNDLNSIFVAYAEELKKSVLASELRQGNGEKEVEIDGKVCLVTIEKM